MKTKSATSAPGELAEEIAALSIENRKLRTALAIIAKWQTPNDLKYTGASGESRFIQETAIEALNNEIQ